MKKAQLSSKPRARVDGLVVRELADEVLVYDLERHKAHCLNGAAVAVWKKCDGQRTAAEIARLVEQESESPFTLEMVWLALHQLQRFSLLEERIALPDDATRISRRELGRRLGLATAVTALPFIASVVAPTAASAASCGALGTFCVDNARCCSGLCINNSCACLGNQSPCTSDIQCCSGRCGSANNKCLP